MSHFGDGTLKQDILDEVRWAKESHGADVLEVIVALAEIIQYFAEGI